MFFDLGLDLEDSLRSVLCFDVGFGLEAPESRPILALRALVLKQSWGDVCCVYILPATENPT